MITTTATIIITGMITATIMGTSTTDG
jgi:hypothetical protein